MLLIFLGSPGSGKGTVSEKMIEEYNFKHISTGDIFRKKILDKSKLGLRVKDIIDSGHLVDDETTWEVAREALEETNILNESIILDGYPRNINQAKLLDDWLLEKYSLKTMPIYFEVSEDEIFKRLSGRIICKKCSRIYHKLFLPPLKEGRCDLDGETLFRREDDKWEDSIKRIEIYKKVTVPLIDYYNSNHMLHKVNGEIPINSIVAEISNLIGRKINVIEI